MYMCLYILAYDMYTYVYTIHTYSDIYEAEGYYTQGERKRERERERKREREREGKRETYIKLKGGNSVEAAHVLPLPALVPRHLNLDQLCVCICENLSLSLSLSLTHTHTHTHTHKEKRV